MKKISTVVLLALTLFLTGWSQGFSQIKPIGDCPDITVVLFGASANECDINVLVKDTQGSTNIDYAWTINGTGILGQTTNNLNTSVTQNGTYVICWTGTVQGSNPPCSDHGCTTVTVTDCEDDPDPDPDPTCPPNQIFVNNVECTSSGGGDASANWNVNASDVAYITWRYSLGPHSNVPLPTTTGNANGLHQVNWNLPQAGQPIPGTWDNYNLVVKARAHLVDGTVCQEYLKIITLDCPPGGGGGGQKFTSLVPNPTHGEVNIVTANKKIIDIKIRNLVGYPVKTTVDKDFDQIDLSGNTPGVYFIEVQYEDGSMEVNKVVLKN